MTDALPLALDALDEVDWASLRHAYGRAEDVPAMLRAWTSTDPEEQAAGADDLFAAVFHQGDVTSAAGPCVPVFVAALRDERPDLWQHAAWYMYAAAVPQGMDPSAVADFHPADHNVPAAYANLSAAVPHLMTMIGNERYSDETRAALCATLAWCPEAPGHVVEGCWHALQRGAGPLLRPALLVLAGLALRRAGEVAADTTWLRASSAAFDETTAAAVGRALAGDPSPEVDTALTEALGAPDLLAEWRPFGLDELDLLAVDAVVRRSFPDGLAGRALDDRQQRALDLVRGWEGSQRFPGAAAWVLRRFGLATPPVSFPEPGQLLGSLAAAHAVRRFCTVAALPDGNLAAATAEDVVVVSWSTGQVTTRIGVEHPLRVMPDPSGRLLAVWTSLENGAVWQTSIVEVASGRVTATLADAGSKITWSADGSVMAANERQGGACLWRVGSWRDPAVRVEGTVEVALNRDGRLAAVQHSRDQPGLLQLIQLGRRRRLATRKGRGATSWHPTADLLAWAGPSLEVLGVDGRTVAEVALKASALAWSPDGTRLATVSQVWLDDEHLSTEPPAASAVAMPPISQLRVMEFDGSRLTPVGPVQVLDGGREVSWHPSGLVCTTGSLEPVDLWHPSLERRLRLRTESLIEGAAFWQALDAFGSPGESFADPSDILQVRRVVRPGWSEPVTDPAVVEGFVNTRNDWQRVRSTVVET